jgi:hypothetical protein
MRLLLTGLHVLLLLPGHLLLLLLVLLLQSLRLLQVLLLQLLLIGLISLLLRQLLVFLLLLLLKLLSFLLLLGTQLLLLLLVFLVLFSVACVGSGRPRNGRELVGMNRSAGARVVLLGPSSLIVLRSCSLGVGLGLLRNLRVVLRRPWGIVLRPNRLRLSIGLRLI